MIRHAAGRAGRFLGLAAMLASAAAMPAQTVPDAQQVPDNTGLDIPQNLQIFGKLDPNIRKATAIVNDVVITGTDVDQRVALIIAANNIQQLNPEELDRLKLQILRQLIDETLEIQEAKAHDIEVTKDEIDQSYARVGKNFNKSDKDFATYLRSIGSSERSMRRQIEGELAWTRYLRRHVEPYINVGDEEVKAILDRLRAAKGTPEYHVREIFIRGQGATAAASAQQVMEQIKGGKVPFETLARNYSDATTKAAGGDLDWVRADTLPAALASAVQEMQVGQVAGPLDLGDGYEIVYLVDKRAVLTADPRDARLELKQITVKFPAGISEAEATTRATAFAKATQALQGCGSVEKVAAGLGAEVVNNDSVRVRDLPPQLQDILIKLQIGQATPPFGSPQDGVRTLVLCGRNDPVNGALPNAEAVQDQIQQQRVNLRATQMLRDLRRDAIVEYR